MSVAEVLKRMEELSKGVSELLDATVVEHDELCLTFGEQEDQRHLTFGEHDHC